MRNRKTGTSRIPDQTSLFLLPFEEVPGIKLISAKQREPVSPNQSIAKASRIKQYFGACLLKRTTNKSLENGNVDENHQGQFHLENGDCVLLRPNDNSIRPGVAKIVSFFKDNSKGIGYARIQWFYRHEDLTKSPTEAAGEDELFETDHFDDVELDSIAGRCEISSYSVWVEQIIDSRSTSRMKSMRMPAFQQGASQETASNASEIPIINVDGPSETATRKDFTSKPSADEMNQEIQNIGNIESRANRRISTNQIVQVDPTNVTSNEEETMDAEELHHLSSPLQRDQDSDDALSCFLDNYEGCAVRYYCRRFYDPRMHVFLISKYEDDTADPLEELFERQNEIKDDDFHPTDAISSSSSLSPQEFSSDEQYIVSKKRTTKKRKLSSTTAGRTNRRRQNVETAGQFVLPTDEGVPKSLPCRDSQKEYIRNFLLGFINESNAENSSPGSRCLYISGVPGTGKTATIREVISDLSAARSTGEVVPFNAVEVNAMSLPDPNLVYSELYTAITGTRGVSPARAAQLLERKFANLSSEAGRGMPKPRKQVRGNRKEMCTILILDEMDVLMARKQKVLYDMLEWPTRRNARLAVIGIANTMDLPERMLPRLGSRLGLNRLSYPPYTSEQIRVILELTLRQSKVKFAKEAIKFCAAKVGAVSGDVRRAMELCRRALDMFMEESESSNSKRKTEEVSIHHINQAIQAVSGGVRLASLMQLSVFEKLLLVTAIYLSRSEGSCFVEATNSVEAVVAKAIQFSIRFSKLCIAFGTPSRIELQDTCSRLAEQRFLLIEKAPVYRSSRVIVNISAEDCLFALRDCDLSKKILSSNRETK